MVVHVTRDRGRYRRHAVREAPEPRRRGRAVRDHVFVPTTLRLGWRARMSPQAQRPREKASVRTTRSATCALAAVY